MSLPDTPSLLTRCDSENLRVAINRPEARRLSRALSGEEATEGTRAYIEKRLPNWALEPGE